MRIEGVIVPPKGKKNRLWGVEIALLGVFTQGKSRKDAYDMAKDAIENLVNKKGFSVSVTPEQGNLFSISANDFATFLAFILTRLRNSYHLSARDVAARLSSSSPNAYVRYEHGKAIPKLDTLLTLLQAIDPKLTLVLRIA